MKLHVLPLSPNSRKVLMVNALTGLNLPVEAVDVAAKAHKTHAFLKLNPNGLLPVLDLDDGTSLWESNAIACRLAALAKSELWPASDLRYDIMRWQFWEGCHWTPACAPFASKHLFGNDGVDIAAATEKFHLRARVLDDHLAGRDWLVGEAMTLADICVAMVLYLRGPCHYPVDGYANILRWVESIEALEAFKAMGGMPQAAE